eukprot:TRINITY_DN7326_c0_g1_i1.p1 TRINITY_DN7326_c0_g1~~TRINITY_DN7326_c0_g1_i1.p1  ORF type:complete len:1027 (-),score=371.02 TRINITY_DN7326_c0_g1_i1:121-3201(-)
MEDVAALEEQLRRALEPNTQTVKDAGLKIRNLLSKPNSIEHLFAILVHSQAPEVRQLGGVLLRRKIINRWSKMGTSKQEEMKKGLRHLLLNDPSSPVRLAAANAISVLAKVLIPANQWPELLQFLFQCTQSPQSNHRQMAMSLFNSITENIGDYLRPHFQTLQSIFQKGLQDPESQVRIASLQAVGSLVEWLKSEEEMRAFKALIPLMIQVIKFCIENDYEEEVTRAFETFDNLIELTELPSVSICIPEIIQFVLEVGGNLSLQLSIRQRALTFIEWILRFRPKAITKFNLIPSIFSVAFPLCAEPDRDLINNNNGKSEKEEELDEDEELLSAHKFGSQLIDLMATTLAPKFTFEPAMKYVGEYIVSDQPAKKRAAITALAVMSEGCYERMSEASILPQILECTYIGFKDQNHKVRESACIALAQFSRYLQPNIVDYSPKILPLLFESLEDSTEAVRMGSCYAIEAFCEELEAHQIEPYVDVLVSKLFHVLQTSQNKEIQELALSGINSTAAAATGSQFLKYSPTILPMMMELMKTDRDEYLKLRCRATECIGIIGNSIGKEAFKPYLLPFMELAVLGCKLNYDLLREYTFGSFCNMAEMLGPEFAEFLPTVLPIIVGSCRSDDGIIYDDDDEEGMLDESDDELDEKKDVHIRTAFLDEKSAACYALGVFASKVKQPFLAYIDEVVTVLLELVEYFHEDVRIACINSLNQILFNLHETYGTKEEGGIVHCHENTRQFLTLLLPLHFQRVKDDDDKTVVQTTLDAISNIFTDLPISILEPFAPQMLESVFELLKSKTVSQSRHEEGDEEDDQAEVSLILSGFDLTTAFGKKFGAKILPFFASICQHLAKFQKAECEDYRSASIGVLAELSDSIGPSVISFLPQLIEFALKGMTDQNPESRSNSAFLCGILLQHGGIAAYQYYQPALNQIAVLFQDPSGLPNIQDNACAALARMIDTGAQLIPLETVIPALLEKIPLRIDMLENKTVYGCLLKLAQSGNPVLNSNMGLFVSAIGRALSAKPEIDTLFD